VKIRTAVGYSQALLSQRDRPTGAPAASSHPVRTPWFSTPIYRYVSVSINSPADRPSVLGPCVTRRLRRLRRRMAAHWRTPVKRPGSRRWVRREVHLRSRPFLMRGRVQARPQQSRQGRPNPAEPAAYAVGVGSGEVRAPKRSGCAQSLACRDAPWVVPLAVPRWVGGGARPGAADLVPPRDGVAFPARLILRVPNQPLRAPPVAKPQASTQRAEASKDPPPTSTSVAAAVSFSAGSGDWRRGDSRPPSTGSVVAGRALLDGVGGLTLCAAVVG
jgi:hypothetical protein